MAVREWSEQGRASRTEAPTCNASIDVYIYIVVCIHMYIYISLALLPGGMVEVMPGGMVEIKPILL
jgi:hypothetical protein